MTNAPKRKGDQFERDVVEVWRARGFGAERMLKLGMRDDHGDIDGVAQLFVECKNCKRYELGQWLDEAVSEAPDGFTPLLIVKRPRRPAAQAYAIVELDTFTRLWRRAQ